MKRLFLILGLLCASTLLAQEDEPVTSCPCVCYTPAWYDMQCDTGLFVSVDFLYWFARECGLSYATKVERTSHSVLAPTRAVNLDTSWDPGVRVGFGWNMPRDGWDLGLFWTYFSNRETDTTSVLGGANYIPDIGRSALQSNWLNNLLHGGQFPLSDSIRAKWEFTLNRLDLELGSRRCLSPCFTLRPYFGLSGIWTETDFKINHSPKSGLASVSSQIMTVTTSGTFKAENCNWSVGLLGGVQPTWQFTPCFALYANIDGALLWGKFKNHQRESSAFALDSAIIELSYKTKNDFYCMQPILDMALGLRYETYWCERRYHFAFDAGWENHLFWDHNYRFNDAGAVTEIDTAFIPSHISTRAYDLAFGGLVLRMHFDF